MVVRESPVALLLLLAGCSTAPESDAPSIDAHVPLLEARYTFIWDGEDAWAHMFNPDHCEFSRWEDGYLWLDSNSSVPDAMLVMRFDATMISPAGRQAYSGDEDQTWTMTRFLFEDEPFQLYRQQGDEVRFDLRWHDGAFLLDSVPLLADEEYTFAEEYGVHDGTVNETVTFRFHESHPVDFDPQPVECE